MKVLISIPDAIVIRNRKAVWKHRLYCGHFCFNLKYLGWLYTNYIKRAKTGSFCEKLLSENNFEAVLANFCCYEYGVSASKAVQKNREYLYSFQNKSVKSSLK